MPAASAPAAPASPATFADLRRAFEQESPAFGQIARALDWEELPEEELYAAIDMALDRGMLQIPREMAARGAGRFPDSERMQAVHRLLRPPTFVRSAPPMSEAQRADQRWLRANGEAHAGRWVALRAGELLAEGRTREELQEKLSEREEREVTTYSKIPGLFART